MRVIGESVHLQGDHQFWVDSVGPEVAKLLDVKRVKGRTVDGQETVGLHERADSDEKVTVTAPPAAQVVDVDKLAS